MQLNQKDDRLDTAIALFLALAMAVGVWLYSVKPWKSFFHHAKPVAHADVPLGKTELRPRIAENVPEVKPLPVPDAAAPQAVVPAAKKEHHVPVVPVVAAAATAVAVAPEPVAAKAPEPAPAPVVAVEPPPAPAPAPVVAAPEPAPAPVVEPPKADPNVVIREHIRFASGSAVVPSSAKARLDEVAGILKNDPRTLTIAGHTDNQGPAAINRALSRARADAVKAYLVAQGVAADKLKAVGLGQDHPIANNKTADGRARNRRIDITE